MIKNITVFIALLFIVPCLIPAVAWPYTETHYVRDGSAGEYGNEDGTNYANAFDGFSDILWDTDNSVDNKVGPGDALYVCGIIDEKLTVGASGLSGAPITIISCTIANGASTDDAGIIDGTGVGQDKTVQWTGRDWVTWDGVDVRDGQKYGIFLETSDNCIVKNCSIYDNGNWLSSGHEGLVSVACDSVTYESVHAYGNGWNGLSFGKSDNCTIIYCSTHDNGHMGINFLPDQVSAELHVNNNLYFNKIYDNYGTGIYYMCATNATIAGNLIYGNGSSGLSMSDNGFYGVFEGNIKVYNNTSVDNGQNFSNEANIKSLKAYKVFIKNNIVGYTRGIIGYGIIIYPDAVLNTEIDYNLYYNNERIKWDGVTYTSLASFNSAHSPQEDNGETGDPLFTNFAGDDFTLQSGSPCIDTGADLGATYDDGLDPDSSWLDSVTTLDQDDHGAGWEIGAYVYEDAPGRVLMGITATGVTIQ